LLPSKSVQALCSKVIVVAVSIKDPLAEKLRGEFDIGLLNCNIIVLDRRGETLDAFMADVAGRCSRESASEFPEKIVARIETALKRKLSLQELRRRWESSHRERDLNELCEWLEGALMHRHLARFCKELAANESFPEKDRVDYTLRAFLSRSRDFMGLEDFANFIAEGEALLIRYPTHHRTKAVAEALFYAGIARSSVVPAAGAACLERLRKAAADSPHKAAIEKHIETIATMLDGLINRNKNYTAMMTTVHPN